MTTANILVADDDMGVRNLLANVLKGEGHSVETAANGKQAISLMGKKQFDIIIVDLKMPGVDGLEVLRELKTVSPDSAGVVITAYGTMESAVDALRLGAIDYLTKPFHMDEIRLLVRRIMDYQRMLRENVALRQRLQEYYRAENIVGQSSEIVKIHNLIRTVSATDSTVLIQGESGTGKELVARAIHYNSSRKDKPLVIVNCVAIPETLLESEMFGYVKGAFTGATSNRMGRFQIADRGTAFLDEIGDMSPRLQAKLLRVLQQQEFEPLGSNTTVKVNVRILAATNKDLDKEVREKHFRPDLFYRLNVIPIRVPPLRERREDIPLLLEHFIKKIRQEKGYEVKGFSAEAVKALQEYNWPGNVRELENLVEQLAVLKREGIIAVADLPEKFVAHATPALSQEQQAWPTDANLDLNTVMTEMEKNLILQALKRAQGVKSKAAKLLNINRTTLIEKMRRYNIAQGDMEQ